VVLYPMWGRQPMITNSVRIRLLAAALAALWAAQALPGNAEILIYKSVDAQGKVSYGDAPLPQAVAVEEIRLAPTRNADSSAFSEQRIEQLAATTDRLRDDRLAREAQRTPLTPPEPVEYAGYPPDAEAPWVVSRPYPGKGLGYPYRWPHRFDRFPGHPRWIPGRFDPDWRPPYHARPGFDRHKPHHRHRPMPLRPPPR
jgi:hypothetical protein